MSKVYRVSMVYSMTGRVDLSLPDRKTPYTAEEVLAYAKEHLSELPLPVSGEYLEDSAEIDADSTVYDEFWKEVY